MKAPLKAALVLASLLLPLILASHQQNPIVVEKKAKYIPAGPGQRPFQGHPVLLNPFPNSAYPISMGGLPMERPALLIFADSAYTDRKRWGWPSAFRILLEMRGFTFAENKGPQQCDLTGLSGSPSTGASFGQRLENGIESLGLKTKAHSWAGCFRG